MDVDGRIDDGGVTVVVFFDLFGSVTRDGDKIVWLLCGGEIGLAKRLHQEAEEEFDEGTKDAETGIFEIAIIGLPIILGGDVAIADVGGMGLVREKNLVFSLPGGGTIRFWLGADGFGFGAGDGDDEIIMAEVEMREIELAQDGENAAEGGGKKIEPAGFDGGIIEPVDALLAVLGGVDGGVGIEVVEFEKNFFGAAFFG